VVRRILKERMDAPSIVNNRKSHYDFLIAALGFFEVRRRGRVRKGIFLFGFAVTH
jgi:hypothetical protein